MDTLVSILKKVGALFLVGSGSYLIFIEVMRFRNTYRSAETLINQTVYASAFSILSPITYVLTGLFGFFTGLFFVISGIKGMTNQSGSMNSFLTGLGFLLLTVITELSLYFVFRFELPL